MRVKIRVVVLIGPSRLTVAIYQKETVTEPYESRLTDPRIGGGAMVPIQGVSPGLPTPPLHRCKLGRGTAYNEPHVLTIARPDLRRHLIKRIAFQLGNVFHLPFLKREHPSAQSQSRYIGKQAKQYVE